MGLDLAMIGGIYRGAQDEIARQDNEARLKARDEREAKQAERMDQEAAFAEETRGRQRKAWTKQDEIESNEKKYRAEFAKLNQSDQVSIPQDALLPQSETKSLQSDENQSEAETKRLLSKVPKSVSAPMPGTAPSANTPVSVTPTPSEATPQQQKSSDQPSATALAPAGNAGTPKLPGGTAQPSSNFNNSLALQQYVLQRKLNAGELDASTYTQHMRNIESFKEEGGARALKLFAQGRNDEAIDAWNSSGQMAGAKLISSKQGTTKIDGVEMPTNFIELQLPGGRVISMDTAKAQKQLLSYEQQLASAQQNRQITNQENAHKDSVTLQREQMAQTAKYQNASLGLQSQHLAMQRQQYADSTPLGRIRLLEEANGKKLSDEEKSNILGLSNMPKATQMQMQSLLKEHEELSKAVAAAQATGTFMANDKDGKPNSVLVRMSLISQQINDLASGNKNPFGDIKAQMKAGGSGAVTTAPPASNTGAQPKPVQAKPAEKKLSLNLGINPALQAAIKNNSASSFAQDDLSVLPLLNGENEYERPEPKLRVGVYR
jgi:hypothetical protein